MTERATGRSLVQRIASTTEAWVFLAMAGVAALLAVVYWFLSYESAGGVLLAGFGLACGIVGARLAVARREGGTPVTGQGRATTEAGLFDGDRPFLDEHGRTPTPTFAPFALGIGVALAATSLVFGPAPLVVAAVPIAWGAADWLTRASAELRAVRIQEDEGPDGDAS